MGNAPARHFHVPGPVGQYRTTEGPVSIMEDKIEFVLDPSFSSLLLESMADGVFTLNDKGEILSWNPAMERITGYTASEAKGKKCTLLNFTRCFSKTCPTNIEECGIYQFGRLDGTECFLRHK